MKATARKAFYHGFTGIDKFQVGNSSFLFQTFRWKYKGWNM